MSDSTDWQPGDEAAEPFALTGLFSLGGLANWTFFFFPDEVVLLNAGLRPALKQGLVNSLDLLTVALGDPGYGPQRDAQQAFLAWHDELCVAAKEVIVLADEDVLQLRLQQNLLAHELWLSQADGRPQRYTLANRSEAEAVGVKLQQRFGDRFVISSSRGYALLARCAPFLTR